MSKGQKRSNRELKKPKQNKVKLPAVPMESLVKQALQPDLKEKRKG